MAESFWSNIQSSDDIGSDGTVPSGGTGTPSSESMSTPSTTTTDTADTTVKKDDSSTVAQNQIYANIAGTASEAIGGLIQYGYQKENTEAAKKEAREIADLERGDALAQQDIDTAYEQRKQEQERTSFAINKMIKQNQRRFDNWMYEFKRQLNKKEILKSSLKNMFDSTPDKEALTMMLRKSWGK